MALLQQEVPNLTEQFERQTTEGVLAWALERFHPRIALATGLQTEGMVVLDLAWRIEPNVRVFTIDTGRLHQETYDMMDRIRQRYGISIEVLFPDSAEVEKMVRTKGLNLFYESVENRTTCCAVRKVNPLRRHLAGLDAWMTGLRRDQSESRADTPKVEIDSAHGGILKINPIADWSQDRIDAYVKAHNLPQHPLYAKGYTSIGCLPCTRATQPGEDPRAGRWWWEQNLHKECGLHLADKT